MNVMLFSSTCLEICTSTMASNTAWGKTKKYRCHSGNYSTTANKEYQPSGAHTCTSVCMQLSGLAQQHMKVVFDNTDPPAKPLVIILNNPVQDGDDIRLQVNGNFVLRLYDEAGELVLTKACHRGMELWPNHGLPKGKYVVDANGERQPLLVL